jgi:hypothetical protein
VRVHSGSGQNWLRMVFIASVVMNFNVFLSHYQLVRGKYDTHG